MKILTLATEKLIRYQTLPISAPIGTAANFPIQAQITLDPAYNQIIGIGFFPITDGDNGLNYQVGVGTARTVWVNPINVGAWIADVGVGPNEKFLQTAIPYSPGDVFIATLIPGLLVATDALAGQIVLVLCRSLTELPQTM